MIGATTPACVAKLRRKSSRSASVIDPTSRLNCSAKRRPARSASVRSGRERQSSPDAVDHRSGTAGAGGVSGASPSVDPHTRPISSVRSSSPMARGLVPGGHLEDPEGPSGVGRHPLQCVAAVAHLTGDARPSAVSLPPRAGGAAAEDGTRSAGRLHARTPALGGTTVRGHRERRADDRTRRHQPAGRPAVGHRQGADHRPRRAAGRGPAHDHGLPLRGGVAPGGLLRRGHLLCPVRLPDHRPPALRVRPAGPDQALGLLAAPGPEAAARPAHRVGGGDPDGPVRRAGRALPRVPA